MATAQEPKYWAHIRELKDKGYTVTENGRLLNPQGVELRVSIGGAQRYPSFGACKRKQVPVHKFAAYVFYGEEAFILQVRHLNANTLDISKNNIKLGTPSENCMDKCPKVRSEAAKIARASQSHSQNAKVTPEMIKEVREAKKGLTRFPYGERARLASKWGVSDSTIKHIVNERYKNFYDRILDEC